MNEDDYLAHYGMPRRSGRYPWGTSGWGDGSDEDTSYQRNKSFLDYIKSLFRRGLSQKEVADGMGISVAQLRAQQTIARADVKVTEINMARRLKEKGWSNGAIAERMGLSGESSVRALLKEGALEKAKVLTNTADMIQAEVDKKNFVDIGVGVEHNPMLGVSQTKLNAAVEILKAKGYQVHTVPIKQIGTGHDTQVKVIAPPGTTQKEIWMNRDKIQQIGMFTTDGGERWGREDHKPLPVDPSRVEVRYAEDGGAEADGMIYVRPGVEDLSLGKARYAQVRVQVGEGHYLKGMAAYKDDLPPGTDLLFNTNKSKQDAPTKLDAMKELTTDPDFPFGSVTRPILSDPGTENERVASAMNLVFEEGDWSTWKKDLSTQVLSKQSPALARSQLNMALERREQEYKDIKALTNPVVKKKLLETYADTTDAAAVHLEAAAMPRQNWHVLLPVDTMPENQIYAPNYRDGEPVVLIRYPHGGTFEIPELTVNNKQRDAKKLLGNAPDAVAINSSVAERLSGADFDGDTVLVIPNPPSGSKRITTTRALEQLKDFNAKEEYKLPPGHPPVKPDRMQQEMGNVSNLITDMTIRQASPNEIARAVKHSMVVIDSEKHGLNIKQSALDNNIKQLKAKYQGGSRSGASTLISRATSEIRVPDRKPRPMSEGGPVDRETGERVYVPTGKTRTTKSGDRVPVQVKSQRLAETRDARTLVDPPGTPIERLYASHSNKLKSLANRARLDAIKTPPLRYQASAARTYSKEVASLNSKLTIAQANAPKERQAQIVANAIKRARLDANPNLGDDTKKKIGFEELEKARARLGAKKKLIDITPREWDAIQAGALHTSKVSSILNNTDVDKVREMATPRTKTLMTTAKMQRAMSMLSSGYTRAQIADQLGVSISTLDRSIYGLEE